MTLGKVTSLPFLIIFAKILSEAKPLMIVSLSTDYSVPQYSVLCAPLCILCLFDQSKSFGMEVFQTHGTLESLLSSTTAIKAFDLDAMCSSKSSALAVDVVAATYEQNFHLLLPLPEAFHQTIVISPVQNWFLIDSCKVSHFST